MLRWSLSLQHQLQCGKNSAHVTVSTLAFVGIASLLSHFKNTTSRLAAFRTITLSSFLTFPTNSRPQKKILTLSRLLYKSRVIIFHSTQVFKTSNAKWLAEKANPLVGRQDPKRVQHTSRNRTLPKLVYRSVPHASHCSSPTSVNGMRIVGITTQARSKVLP